MLGTRQRNSKTDARSRKWLVGGALVTAAMGAGAYAMRKRRNAGGADDVTDGAASGGAQGKDLWGTAGDTVSETSRDLTDAAKSASSTT